MRITIYGETDMAFGPIMRIKLDELTIELAPFERDDTRAFVDPGMQQHSVVQYIDQPGTVFVFADEQEWYDKIRADKDRIIWGIWAVENDTRTLIGNSAIFDMKRGHTIQGTTGIIISDKSYWGKGIASAAHKARTWYAFQHLGLTRLKSAVIQGNDASRKALEKVGYNFVYTERNEKFTNGKLHHMDCFECLNPDEQAWNLWWGEDTPSESALAARARTREVMAWAEQNVELL